jgi:hypothetical protein
VAGGEKALPRPNEASKSAASARGDNSVRCFGSNAAPSDDCNSLVNHLAKHGDRAAAPSPQSICVFATKRGQCWAPWANVVTAFCAAT